MLKNALKASLMAGILLAAAAPMATSAQGGRAAYKAPRTSWGAPNLSGNWTNATITPVQRPTEYGERMVHTPQEVARLEGQADARVEAGNRTTDPNAPPPTQGADVGGYNRGWLDPGTRLMRVNGEPRTSFLTTPGGRFPEPKAQPPAGGRGAAAAAAAGRGGGGGGQFDNPERRPLGERCIISFGRNAGPPMLPNGFYNNNYQFVLTEHALAIVVEMVHDTRVIRIGGEHRKDAVRPWFGDSVGRWEGETLVVETTHMPQRLQYQGSWENLKVVERFTRVAPDRMLYRFEIHDPTRWDRPWGGEYEFGELDGRLHEYACHEGNYALEGILAGARADEATAAARSQPVATR